MGPGRASSARDAAETVAQALARGVRYLARRGVALPERNARFLLAHALSAEPRGLAVRSGDLLAGAERRRYGKLLCRRGSRVPLQHLLGAWEFWGLELEVGPAALVPRPETESLVERVLAEIGAEMTLAADIGTGTGCVAIALAHERPGLRVVATDVSPAAVELAARNVGRHRLGDRIELAQGEFLAPLAGRCRTGSLDAVVSNPPYVAEADLASLEPEVRDHEPRLALISGPSGLEAIERIAADAPGWLRSGGLLALEIGFGQEQAAVAAVAGTGEYRAVTVSPDLAGIPRVLTARRR